ncbi:phage portal protein [Virgibacillus halodenitrificans]|uniref:phage portal protein n=1 Tax=Virgibacillus halodenitrificans TaxID=1482 RepID=UPI00136BB02B|nr:phage portal protein [Virgibacillus halodenitrificans]MYL45045.1 phage portal protein [Virgibacillus halodenitrificans]
MAKWIDKAVGEMSRLRNNLSRLGWSLVGGSFTSSYKLDSSRVDYDMARKLYNNTDDNYKLGAGFAKPIVNATVGFMGVPSPKIDDEEAQEKLTSFFEDNMSKLQRTIRNAGRDGDVFVWVTREDVENNKLYPEKGKRLVYNIIPPEQVKKINRDPVTNKPREYILVSTHSWEDENGNAKRTEITQIIGADYRKIKCKGDAPPGIEEGEFPNQWGFIPIVHFKNESDEHEEFGKSDLESIEPFMKAYHDVMMHAIQGSKLHSTPRLKLKLKDVASFLKNNFGVDDPAKFAKEGGTINLDSNEILFLTSDEEAEFIEVNSATGDAAVLLKFLFYCIVDTSETPEFIFGVHTPSSHASVKEQMPILVRRIERKREAFDEPFKLLCRIVLAMTSDSENIQFSSYSTELEWDDIDPRDGKEVAEEIKIVAEALGLAKDKRIISDEAAVQFLKKYISTMNEYESEDEDITGERDRIMKSRLMSMQLEDSQFNEGQLKEIDKILAKMKEK